MVDDGTQFKARSLVTLTELEASGALHQIGDAPKIVDRVRQSEMGENSGLTRSTVTKRISRLAGPKIINGVPLWPSERRAIQSQNMKRVVARHPHWKGQATGHRPQATGGEGVQPRTQDERSRVECDPHQAAGNGSLSTECVSGIQAAESNQSGGENQSGVHSASPAWLLVRNSGFATPNSYALGTDDRRPGMKAASDPCEHARWLASHFGAHMFDPTATAPGGGSLNGFRKDMGFWSAPELPDAPDCECVLQRRLDFKNGKRKLSDTVQASAHDHNGPTGTDKQLLQSREHVGGASSSDGNGPRTGIGSGAGEEVYTAGEDGEPGGSIDCPRCGGCGYTIAQPTEANGYKGTMGDYDRLVGRWLNDRGIDQEIRWCKSCKRSYSQDNAPHYPQCPGCNSGAESEIRKHRGILEGYSMQEIADANGLHVSTVQRIFKVFRRLMLIRTVYGKKWRQCQMCRGAWYDAKECPKCGNKCGEIKASEKAKHLWLPVRFMDKWLALAEKQRLEALLDRQERLHLVPEQMNALKLAVAAAMGLLYQWEGHEHQLQSFYNELRRRLDTDQFRRFLNLLFPLPFAADANVKAGESPPNTS